MTYSESAQGQMIGFLRAEREVLKHGHTTDSPEYYEFLTWYTNHKNEQNMVDAGELLGFLGY